jgi:hypothetical protein
MRSWQSGSQTDDIAAAAGGGQNTRPGRRPSRYLTVSLFEATFPALTPASVTAETENR